MHESAGTLTKNKLEIIDLKEYDGSFLNVLSSLEKHSSHPIAGAITEQYPGGNLTFDDFEQISAEGILAHIGKDSYYAGNLKLLSRFTQEIPEDINYAKENNYSFICVGRNDRILGIVYLADVLKDSSVAAIASLQKRGIVPIMCTGDNEITAAGIAKKLNLNEYMSSVTPQDKNRLVSEKKESGKPESVSQQIFIELLLSTPKPF